MGRAQAGCRCRPVCRLARTCHIESAAVDSMPTAMTEGALAVSKREQPHDEPSRREPPAPARVHQTTGRVQSRPVLAV